MPKLEFKVEYTRFQFSCTVLLICSIQRQKNISTFARFV